MCTTYNINIFEVYIQINILLPPPKKKKNEIKKIKIIALDSSRAAVPISGYKLLCTCMLYTCTMIKCIDI